MDCGTCGVAELIEIKTPRGFCKLKITEPAALMLKGAFGND